jgi:hypothetical protein
MGYPANSSEDFSPVVLHYLYSDEKFARRVAGQLIEHRRREIVALR